MARKKSNIVPEVQENEQVVEKKEEIVEKKVVKKVEKKTFKPDDIVACKSIFAGKLLYEGRKSKIVYEFSNIGDTQFVEYQDLKASALSKASILYKPLVIIDDEEVLEDRAFSKLKEIYENLYDEEDIETLLDMPTRKFEKEIKMLPVGVLNSLATLMSTRIQEGTFDSMNKVKALDELCGTDLSLLLH